MLSDKIVRKIFQKANGNEDEFMLEYNKHIALIEDWNNVDDKLKELKEEYEKQRRILLDIRKGIEGNCEHIATTYHRDASGNNDNWTSCDVCGNIL